MWKRFLLIAILGFSLLTGFRVTNNQLPIAKNVAVKAPSRIDAWVDSVLASMTEDEKIGQFFMVATYSNRPESHYQYIESLVQNHKIGGLIFFQGSPSMQVSLINRYQQLAKIPLMVSIDGEYGLGMRLDGTMSFPQQMTVGAVQDNRLVYEMGQQMAKHCRRVGVHVNFSPVVDINTNANNPVIGNRSFGDQRDNVANKGLALMKGLQSQRVLACAKHFVGHGDTEKDSHFGVPIIPHDEGRLHNTELYPFKKLMADSLMSILVGHLQVPFYDNKVASISDKIVTNLLKNQLNYQGLIFTDALNMRGVKRGMPPGEVELQAFLAGNDILLYAENVVEGTRKIKDALTSGRISIDEVNTRVRKVLKAKYWAGLQSFKAIDQNNLRDDLHDAEAYYVKQKIYENAVTIVKNTQKVIPVRNVDVSPFVSVGIDIGGGNSFQQALDQYASFRHFASDSKSDEGFFNDVLQNVDSSKIVVVGIHGLRNSPARRFGVSWNTQEFVRKLSLKSKVILCVFGSPYCLRYFPDIESVVCSYEDDPQMHNATAQVLFGALPAKGKLPVAVDNLYASGTGLGTSTLARLSYGLPESVGISTRKLRQIDDIVGSAISNRVFPGCQVVIAKSGKVILQKQYGKLSYDSPEGVRENTVYDLASVTKVMATLQTIMFLYDRRTLDLTQKASFYLPELKGTNKENIIVRDLLTHQAGLLAYLPFWERTRSQAGLKPEFYSNVQSADYPYSVAEGVFAHKAMRDSVWKWIVKTPLINKRDSDGRFSYVYSDFSFVMLWRIAEKLLNQPMEEFLKQNFYEPLDLKTVGYNPLQNGISRYQIAPTENDNVFREKDLRGTVQDQMAAMQGGVSGHAGLFGAAQDLVKLAQMNLQKGQYGGRRFFVENTIPFFAQSHSSRSNRGLGWDKLPADGESTFISEKASSQAFGHSGYTGTVVWIDPKYDLVFVMLSNRVHPSAANNKINTLKIRRKVMDVIYKAID
jgi:beta-N-acetylhexosaminidase